MSSKNQNKSKNSNKETNKKEEKKPQKKTNSTKEKQNKEKQNQKSNEKQNKEKQNSIRRTNTQSKNEKNANKEGSLLIEIVNKLHDAFTKLGIANLDLPQIAVVGCQSSGKSSVLESVVGRDFLPRGSGIVTRRPLVLQLIRDTTLQEEYGVFLHQSKQKYYDFDEIRQEIERDTERITGRNKGLSPLPINLRLYSPNVVNLTLIDLPGVTKIAVGDQPEDIEKQIESMVLNYIKRPNCIILAVTPANSDLANSDSLKLAKSVDPKRERTIGVLTKLDLMDEGTDALDILNGDLLGMKFIGVVNRGQKDIDQKKKVKEALSSEETFFQTHPKYAHIADKMGSGYLATILNNKLIQHIQNSLPEISKSVDENLSKTESELEKIGETEGEIQRKQIAFRSLSGFAQEFKNLIDGTSSDVDGSVVSKFSERLLGGAKIKYHYTTALHDNIEDLRLEDDLDEETISKYIQNSEGAISRMGIPEKAFHWAIRVGLLRLFEPCKKCIMDVEKELIGIITDTTNKIQYFENFPMLRTRILEISIALIKRLTKPTLELIEQVIRMELAYINFENPTLHIRRFTEDKKSDILEGWLEKRRSKTKKWQRRWFVLKAKTLFYYSGPKEPTALGVVPLEGCIIETVDDIEKIKKELEEKKDDPEVSKKLIDFPEGPTDQPKRKKSIFSKSKNYPIPEQNLKTYFRIRHPINTVDGGEFMELLAENEVALKTWCSSLKRNAQGIFHEKNQANRDIWLVREVVISYFRTVKISIFDSVPKTVMYSLVNPLKSILEGELMARIYDEELMDELLNEDPAIKDRRKKLKRTLILLKQAKEIIKKVQTVKVNTKI